MAFCLSQLPIFALFLSSLKDLLFKFCSNAGLLLRASLLVLDGNDEGATVTVLEVEAERNGLGRRWRISDG